MEFYVDGVKCKSKSDFDIRIIGENILYVKTDTKTLHIPISLTTTFSVMNFDSDNMTLIVDNFKIIINKDHEQFNFVKKLIQQIKRCYCYRTLKY